MKKLSFILPSITLLLSFFPLLSQENTIKGKIIDKRTKEPLPAYVMIKEIGEGLNASDNGYFELNIEKDEIDLLIYLIGYKTKEIRVRRGEFVRIELEPEPISAHEIVVSADARISDDKSQKTVTLNKLDVYKIPGAAGDPVNAAQILPGVNSIPDASNLIIRGGAPDEVGYYLDGIEIKHPYQSESLKEGYFSIFDNQMIENFSVSTTGFSPKFGDALSGIMDISIKDWVSKKELALGISILGINLFTTLPLGKNVGFIGSANAGHSRLMTEINGEEGWIFRYGESIGKFIFKINDKTNFKLLYLIQGYKFSDEIENFNVKTSNQILGLSLNSILSKNLFSKITFSTVNYKSSYIFPWFPFDIEDAFLQGRWNLTWEWKGHLLESGLDVQKRVNDFISRREEKTSTSKGNRLGFYIHDKFRIFNNLFATMGVRGSALDLIQWKFSWDPRLSLAYLIKSDHILRFSAGIYHQFGDYLIMKDNPSLKPKTSVHYSLSYDRVKENENLRISLYEKRYKDLFLYEGDQVTNNGYGYARGAELFFKSVRKSFEFTWVYNFLNSKRKENDVLVLSRSPYEINHSFTLIITMKRKYDSLSMRWSYASGLPYTPLLGREWDEEDKTYKPIWGEPFSQRYTPFKRVDISIGKGIKIGKRTCFLYLGVMNIFNTKNILRYEYNEDYSSQRTIGSIFPRTFFIGFYSPF